MLYDLGGLKPIDELVKIIHDKDTPLDIRTKILLDLLPYIYPKRKQIEANIEMEKFTPIEIKLAE